MKIAVGVPCDLDNEIKNGFQSYFKTICDNLSKHKITIFAPNGGDIKLQGDLLSNFNLVNQYKNTMILSKNFAEKVKAFDYDVILAFTNMGLSISDKFVYYTSNVPYKRVLKLVEEEYPKTPYFQKLLNYYEFVANTEKANYEKAEKIIVSSKKIMEAIIQEHNIDPKKLVYIPRPIPVIEKLTLKEDKDIKKMKIILMPAEIRVMKGIYYAIETMKLLKKEIPHAVLVICGRINNYEKEFMKELLEEARGKANIIVAGFLSKKKLYDYMSLAECAFMPFCFDECPVALNECLGHGLPIVTNEYAGYEKEVINKFGYCAEYKNIQDYAMGLKKMLLDSDFNLNKRKGALDVRDEFNASVFQEKFVNVLESIRKN